MKRRNKTTTVVLSILVILAVIAISLPKLLHTMGLHPEYDGEQYDLKGKKALIVTTSHGVLNKPGEIKGKKTGVFASEMTIPYYEFLDANMEVDLASIKGGEIPIDPQSFYYFLKSPQDKRFEKDEEFQNKVMNSLPVAEVDFNAYDVVFFAGGWGAAYDLSSEEVGQKVSAAYYDSEALFGSVCHGALAFTEARDTSGNYLIAGRTMSGVTQKQLNELGIEFTPKHPQEELEKAGANYKYNTRIIDPLATLTVVDEEKRFVTGQNQNSSHETAQLLLKLLNEE